MSVSSGMADCAVAPDGLCLRIAPSESLDVTKLAHAFVTLARPRRGCRSRAAWLCAVLGPRRRPAGQDPLRASARGQGVVASMGLLAGSVLTDYQIHLGKADRRRSRERPPPGAPACGCMAQISTTGTQALTAAPT